MLYSTTRLLCCWHKNALPSSNTSWKAATSPFLIQYCFMEYTQYALLWATILYKWSSSCDHQVVAIFKTFLAIIYIILLMLSVCYYYLKHPKLIVLNGFSFSSQLQIHHLFRFLLCMNIWVKFVRTNFPEFNPKGQCILFGSVFSG